MLVTFHKSPCCSGWWEEAGRSLCLCMGGARSEEMSEGSWETVPAPLAWGCSHRMTRKMNFITMNSPRNTTRVGLLTFYNSIRLLRARLQTCWWDDRSSRLLSVQLFYQITRGTFKLLFVALWSSTQDETEQRVVSDRPVKWVMSVE